MGKLLGDGAGEGNRTLVFSLEGCCSTIELHPRCVIPYHGMSAVSTRLAAADFGAKPPGCLPIGPEWSLNTGRFAAYIWFSINNERR